MKTDWGWNVRTINQILAIPKKRTDSSFSNSGNPSKSHITAVKRDTGHTHLMAKKSFFFWGRQNLRVSSAVLSSRSTSLVCSSYVRHKKMGKGVVGIENSINAPPCKKGPYIILPRIGWPWFGWAASQLGAGGMGVSFDITDDNPILICPLPVFPTKLKAILTFAI